MEFRFPGNIKDVSVKFKTDKDEVDPVAVLRIVIEADENQLARADIPIGEQAAPYAASQIVALAKKAVHVQLATPQIELALEQEPVAVAVATGLANQPDQIVTVDEHGTVDPVNGMTGIARDR